MGAGGAHRIAAAVWIAVVQLEVAGAIGKGWQVRGRANHRVIQHTMGQPVLGRVGRTGGGVPARGDSLLDPESSSLAHRSTTPVVPTTSIRVRSSGRPSGPVVPDTPKGASRTSTSSVVTVAPTNDRTPFRAVALRAVGANLAEMNPAQRRSLSLPLPRTIAAILTG